MRALRALLGNRAGSVVTAFGLAVPVIVGGSALAIDAAQLMNERASLQSVADATALAGAKQMRLYREDNSDIEPWAQAHGRALLAEQGFPALPDAVEVTVDSRAATVTVTVSATPATLVLANLGYADTVEATAVARAFGSSQLCVLALDESGAEAIVADRAASITAPECAVQSNSHDPSGIAVRTLSEVTATAICSAGGVDGPGDAFHPSAETDCPEIEDPLVDQALPAVGGCDYVDTTILLGLLRTIGPGHYCGGLRIMPGSLVRALPGEYVISGGPLDVGLGASLTGENVSFRFVDEDSTFSFGVGSIVNLTAPVEGPMAGFLFFQDPGAGENEVFSIATDLATNLLGTIYLPDGVLRVDVVGIVAAQSAYTVIVADRLDIRGADLRINSDYGATDVPVPAGVGPNGTQVALDR
jgi:Flp pilus assembly protein TadG